MPSRIRIAEGSDVRVDQPQSHDDPLLDELTPSGSLADPAVVTLVKELTAEISRLRASSGTSDLGHPGASVETLTGLLLGQAAELQETRERLQRLRALIELTAWAAEHDGDAVDPTVRISDVLHAIGGPIAERTS